jgi:enterochelin esterase-like enzyme
MYLETLYPGSVHRNKEQEKSETPWIINFFETSMKLSLNIFISAGKLENKPLLNGNRTLYKTLKEREYSTYYSEFNGGHDDIWWRQELQLVIVLTDNFQ